MSIARREADHLEFRRGITVAPQLAQCNGDHQLAQRRERMNREAHAVATA
jgi:hypothetical protein